MRSNYSRLGDYIREVNVRNRDLAVTELRGLSVAKCFIPSIANTIGTDMSTYKIVSNGQFVYIADTSRRGDKIAIALQGECNNIIVSQAYTVFEVIDMSELLPEYLMMWFMRPEFDRYARYKSHGSAREIFDWSEMCDVELPIPSPEKQRAIVKEYQTLTDRIKLNETLCAKLEQTAQALYRKMFIDNIDPENLPAGWRMGVLSDIAEFKNGKAISATNGDYPIYGGNGIVGYVDSYNAENTIVIGRVGINCGSLFLESNRCWANDNAMTASHKKGCISFLYWLMRNLDLNSQSEGSGQPLLTQTILSNQICIVPKNDICIEFENKITTFMEHKALLVNEIDLLINLQGVLLSKISSN